MNPNFGRICRALGKPVQQGRYARKTWEHVFEVMKDLDRFEENMEEERDVDDDDVTKPQRAFDPYDEDIVIRDHTGRRW